MTLRALTQPLLCALFRLVYRRWLVFPDGMRREVLHVTGWRSAKVLTRTGQTMRMTVCFGRWP